MTLITDSSRYSGELFFSQIEQALSNGLDAVLVREKSLTSAKLLALASRLREMTRLHQAQLIIHSQADIAEAVDADGVHLSSADLGTVPLIRSWLNNPDRTISVSCHQAQELDLAAQAGADYAMLSPAFPTASHPGAPCLGVETFRRIASQAKLPVVALGGIHCANCSTLNWPNIAVISAILASHDAGAATRALKQCMINGRCD
ncbi:MAG: thiamine phosphate synthase [Mariprofundus sp.]|nr:thiamine phosphate synthase [Mariprofundus sp.]